MITDELREWMYGHTVNCSDNRISLVAIADRIDAEHERAVSEQPYTIDMVPITDENMANHGWIRAPLDADGVLILDGDKMVAPHNGNVFIVTHMMLENGTWTVHGWKPSLLHHHKSPVEDVLTEFSCVLMGKREFDGDVTDAIAEYAAKLCLKEDE